MEAEFIPYEQALALKELEFDEPCFATFFSVGAWQIDCVEGALNLKSNTFGEYSILAPLYQQAFRWFREKYSIFSFIDKTRNGGIFQFSIHKRLKNENSVYEFGWNVLENSKEYNSYEEAELECLRKLIEIVKNK